MNVVRLLFMLVVERSQREKNSGTHKHHETILRGKMKAYKGYIRNTKNII
jgi:hypothetical protein